MYSHTLFIFIFLHLMMHRSNGNNFSRPSSTKIISNELFHTAWYFTISLASKHVNIGITL
ncbi:hypothetical protein DERP_006738 [Dermatophagoides pteronyssinus]|uniref:Uncharacterized protein n=1 Tax=Dermatophagoides pteronyssinus TaxID=6956 RepID=A0ABQ8IRZ8_DERPT|nr:hypothetical protein DERP_006738 [Dermatophagoides pteronyssinus]